MPTVRRTVGKRATESALQYRNRDQRRQVNQHQRRREEDEQPAVRCGADPTEPNDDPIQHRAVVARAGPGRELMNASLTLCRDTVSRRNGC
jgi:hypothetical protein